MRVKGRFKPATCRREWSRALSNDAWGDDRRIDHFCLALSGEIHQAVGILRLMVFAVQIQENWLQSSPA
jgi:hypothetical protein